MQALEAQIKQPLPEGVYFDPNGWSRSLTEFGGKDFNQESDQKPPKSKRGKKASEVKEAVLEQEEENQAELLICKDCGKQDKSVKYREFTLKSLCEDCVKKYIGGKGVVTPQVNIEALSSPQLIQEVSQKTETEMKYKCFLCSEFFPGRPTVIQCINYCPKCAKKKGVEPADSEQIFNELPPLVEKQKPDPEKLLEEAQKKIEANIAKFKEPQIKFDSSSEKELEDDEILRNERPELCQSLLTIFNNILISQGITNIEAFEKFIDITDSEISRRNRLSSTDIPKLQEYVKAFLNQKPMSERVAKLHEAAQRHEVEK